MKPARPTMANPHQQGPGLPDEPTLAGLGGRSIGAGVLLFALPLIAFAPAMRAGFIWDDDLLVTNNRMIEADDGLYAFWFTTEPTDYFPLTSTVFWLEWRLWGMDPTGYHVVNIILHALAAVVIWRVLERLKLPGAYLAAAIFAVHPVTVASVAWISELKNTLSLLLLGLSMLVYLRFEDGRGRGGYGLALVLFLLALLAKTSVVMMPVVLLALAWWRRGRISKADLVRTAPFFVLSLVLGLATVYFQVHNSIGSLEVRPEGLFSRLAASGWCVWFYLYKAVIPLGLSMIYPRWQVDPTSPMAWAPLIGLVALLVVAWRFRRGWGRAVLACLGVFVAMLWPVLGFLDMTFQRYSLVSDHLQYAALIGPVALAVSAGAVVLHRPLTRWMVALILLAGLSAATFSHARVYQNELNLWSDTVAKNPAAWVAHNGLANAVLFEGDSDLAMRHYRQAVSLNPDYAKAHGNLGNVLLAHDRLDEAISHYRLALKIKPDDGKANDKLGLALLKQGKLNEAIGHYRRAVRVVPDFAPLHHNLGVALLRRGDLEGAIQSYRNAIEVNPEYALAHNNLGRALSMQDSLDDAILHYARAVEIDPDWADAHCNLGLALSDTGQVQQALEHFQKAVKLKPGWFRPLNDLAWLLATHPLLESGRPLDAVGLAERAAELTQRQSASVLDTLAAAYAAAGQFDRAVETARTALVLTQPIPNHPSADGIRERLELYQQGKPYRQAATGPGEPGP